MKHLLLTTIAAVLVVGCGESQQSAPAPESKPVEPVVEAAQPAESSKPLSKANSALMDAAKKGNIEAIKQHLTDGADVNVKGIGGMEEPRVQFGLRGSDGETAQRDSLSS